MKITIDASSALFGGAAALVLGLLSGFSPQSTPVPPARPVNPVSTMSMRPAARDIVWLEAQSDMLDPNSVGSWVPGTGFSSPVYTVPAGKILVVTGLSASSPYAITFVGTASVYGYGIEIDGATKRYQYSAGTDVPNGGITFDVGIPLGAGQTVRVLEPEFASGQTSVNLHGYLEDA